MRWLIRTLTVVVLLFRPLSVLAAWPKDSTGIAVPSAEGISLDGSRLGDDDYDLSRPQSGRVLLTGRDGWLSCHGVFQATDLDDKGSTFSALTLMLERRPASVQGGEDFFSSRIAAGLSYTSMDIELLGADGDTVVWILQFDAFVGVRVSTDILVDLRYRALIPLHDPKKADEMPLAIGVDRHHFLVGVRAGF